jgi:hypothetical protein|nr:MAG TPA: hypothetical protein [Caudoviricetes sp.]
MKTAGERNRKSFNQEGIRIRISKLVRRLKIVDCLGSRFTLKRYEGNSYQTKREVERRHKIFNDTRPHDDIDDLIEALEFENFMRDEYEKK